MFERIKNIMSGLGYVWKYGDLIRSVTVAWSSYPGLDSADDLRNWVRPLLLDVSALASLTATRIDDIVALAGVRLVDNNHTWTAIHSLALLARDGGFVDGVRVPQSQQAMLTRELFDLANSEIPENPAVILSAVGLLLYLLQQRQRQHCTLPAVPAGPQWSFRSIAAEPASVGR